MRKEIERMEGIKENKKGTRKERKNERTNK